MNNMLSKENRMKKRFASFLLTGKAATLPLLPATSFAGSVSDSIFGSTLHVLEHSTDGSVSLLSEFEEAGVDGSSYGTTAAQVNFPMIGTGCTYADPTTMNIVVTGLAQGEQVFVLASRMKDYPDFALAYPGLRIGSDFTVVSSFIYSSTGADSAVGIVSIPVNLADLGLAEGETIYLQAGSATFTDGIVRDYGTFRFSELDEVTGVAEDCSYSGGGSSY